MSGAVEGVALAERLRAAVTYQYMPMSVRKLLSEAAQALTTPPARSYADGIEAAAKVCEYKAELITALVAHDGNVTDIRATAQLTLERVAEAIRLLSQGKKA